MLGIQRRTNLKDPSCQIPSTSVPPSREAITAISDIPPSLETDYDNTLLRHYDRLSAVASGGLGLNPGHCEVSAGS